MITLPILIATSPLLFLLQLKLKNVLNLLPRLIATVLIPIYPNIFITSRKLRKRMTRLLFFVMDFWSWGTRKIRYQRDAIQRFFCIIINTNFSHFATEIVSSVDDKVIFDNIVSAIYSQCPMSLAFCKIYSQISLGFLLPVLLKRRIRMTLLDNRMLKKIDRLSCCNQKKV